MTKLFFSVGEPSGDLHGANLIRELQKTSPQMQFCGLGGPRMRAAGCDLLRDMTDLAVMGLWPVLARLPEFFGLLARVDEFLAREQPDAVVLIDYPGFNWHVARKAKQRGIPVVYYGLPQLWAWASWRVSKVRNYVDHALCKLPFEEGWFRERGCNATYVGHPYFDELASQKLNHEFLAQQVRSDSPLITLLPGSRSHEVKYNLPDLLSAAIKIRRERPEVRFAIASYNEKQALLAQAIAAQRPPVGEIFVGRTPELIHAAHGCLAVSGSVSLELLYHEKPAAIIYKASWLTYQIVRRLVAVKYITLPNLLITDDIYRTKLESYEPDNPAHAGVLYPEYPTASDRSDDLARHALHWLTDEPARQSLIGRLRALKSQLAHCGASANAARYLLENVLPQERSGSQLRAA